LHDAVSQTADQVASLGSGATATPIQPLSLHATAAMRFALCLPFWARRRAARATPGAKGNAADESLGLPVESTVEFGVRISV
jgi:hypothetical protein